jgi:hypothetical protein
MLDRNRYMLVVLAIVCSPLLLTGCPVPSGVVGNLCSAVAAAGGSPAPGICPAAGQSANPDFVIIPSPGSSGQIVIIGLNGPSSPAAASSSNVAV